MRREKYWADGGLVVLPLSYLMSHDCWLPWTYTAVLVMAYGEPRFELYALYVTYRRAIYSVLRASAARCRWR